MDAADQSPLAVYYAQLSAYVSTLHRLWSTEQSQSTLSIFGTAVLLFFAYKAILTLWFWIKPGNIQMYCHSETGSWALVTGASDGIGQAYSNDLLKRGFNVLLHGRNPQKLERVRKEFVAKYPKRTVDVVVVDASKADDGYNKIIDKVDNLPGKLTILVNNVGGITTSPQYVPHGEIPHENIDTQLNVNIRFPTQLTRALLPTLRKNGPSLILNCGSTGGLVGMPYIVTYSACKAYMHHFTESLRVELAAEGIDNVETLCYIIGNVISQGNKFRLLFTSTSDECAKACLDRVGCGQPLTFPDWPRALQLHGAQLLPERVVQMITANEMKKRVNAQKKGL